jgi:UDP-N-acetylmuramyl pentapeptide phosphotransferase/UDP-N-acetylglucosamine-1-phosphate transferase
MQIEKYYLLFFFFFLTIINYSLLKFKILLHQKYTQKHKRFGHNQIPLSGGIYFFFVVLLLFIELNLISFTFVSFFFLFLFLGLIVDQKDNLTPKVRFCLQLLLTTILVYVNELYILKTNIFL